MKANDHYGNANESYSENKPLSMATISKVGKELNRVVPTNNPNTSETEAGEFSQRTV